MTRSEYLQTFVMEVLADTLDDLAYNYEVEHNGKDPLMLDEELEPEVEKMRLAMELIRERLYNDDN